MILRNPMKWANCKHIYYFVHPKTGQLNPEATRRIREAIANMGLEHSHFIVEDTSKAKRWILLIVKVFKCFTIQLLREIIGNGWINAFGTQIFINAW